MRKIDIIRKLSSRKFQMAIIGVLIPLFALTKIDEITQKHLIALTTALFSIVSYIFAEAYVDGKRESVKNDETLENNGGGVLSKGNTGGKL